ncbi:MAG TPA: hypothetical protein PLG31_01135 [Spirochaetota bacterium]|nr:hypothetical protein [Spirochaetota bacterium]
MRNHRTPLAALLAVIMIAVLAVAAAAATGNVRFVNVSVDKNGLVMKELKEEQYWVDTGGIKRIVELHFSDPQLFSRRPAGLSLILNIPDIEEADSEDGLDVFLNDRPVGSVPRVARNTWLEIPLDVSAFDSAPEFFLVIKSKTSDSIAIASKKSGFGAVIKAVYR